MPWATTTVSPRWSRNAVARIACALAITEGDARVGEERHGGEPQPVAWRGAQRRDLGVQRIDRPVVAGVHERQHVSGPPRERRLAIVEEALDQREQLGHAPLGQAQQEELGSRGFGEVGARVGADRRVGQCRLGLVQTSFVEEAHRRGASRRAPRRTDGRSDGPTRRRRTCRPRPRRGVRVGARLRLAS